MSDDPTPVVSDHPELRRYQLALGRDMVGLLDYRIENGSISLIHAEIDPAHRHRGLGAVLAREALADARARGLHVIPLCRFVVDFLARHPGEYDDLLSRSPRPPGRPVAGNFPRPEVE